MTISRGMDALKRLELSENARWFVAGLLAMALVWLQLGSRPGVAADPEGVITAQSFRLVDDNGVVRGCLGFNEEETPMLLLCNELGEKQLVMVAEQTGSTIYLFGKNSQPAIIIDADQHKGQQIFLTDKEKGSVVNISNTNMSLLYMMNAKDGPVVGFAAAKDQALMHAATRLGESSITLSAKKKVGSMLFLCNGVDDGQLSLLSSPKVMTIMAKNEGGDGFAFAVRKNRAPAMELTENGRAVWSALGGGPVDDAEMRGLFGGAGSGLNLDKLFK